MLLEKSSLPTPPSAISNLFSGEPILTPEQCPASPPFQLSWEAMTVHPPWDEAQGQLGDGATALGTACDTGIRGGSQLWSQPRLYQAAFQTPLWWAGAPCCARERSPRGSRNCGDCSSCSVELPAGHGERIRARIPGYVKGIQSCQGAEAVGVGGGTNKGRGLNPCRSLLVWNIPWEKEKKKRRLLGSVEAVGISAMSTELH